MSVDTTERLLGMLLMILSYGFAQSLYGLLRVLLAMLV